MSRLADLLALVDAAGGGLTLRPTGANVFIPSRERGGSWSNYGAKRHAGETMAALAERALERAAERWGL